MRSLCFLPTFATLATALVVAVGCARSELVIALDRGGEDVDRLYDSILGSVDAADHINGPRVAVDDVHAALNILVGVPSPSRNRPRRALTRACCDLIVIRTAGRQMGGAPHLWRGSDYRSVTTAVVRRPRAVCLFGERFCPLGQPRAIESPCTVAISRGNDCRSVRQVLSSEIINSRRDL